MDFDSAFKRFDIRGPFPKVVNVQLAFNLGLALIKFKKPSKVLIASDTRQSSPQLKKYLSDAFISSGVETCDLAEVPIPQFYYTVAVDGYDLGVMVTASHNTDTENGFKFVGRNGLPFDEGEILTLKKFLSSNMETKIVVNAENPKRINSSKSYVAAIKSFAKISSIKSRLVLDVTKSSVSSLVPGLFSDLHAPYSLVKSDHQGNPLIAQNRSDLAKLVISERADLGIIWDTDGDRVAFVDRDGDLIPISFVLAILGREAVNNQPGAKVAVDVRAGLVVHDLVTQAGGQLQIVPSWHQNLQFAMLSDPSIVFAGENSSHLLYRDFYKIDDGILASLMFLKIFETETLEEELKELKHKYFELPETNFSVPAQKTPAILQRLTDFYREQNYPVSLEDGLTVFGPDWKFNLRQSATESLLRLNLEARNSDQANNIVQNIENRIQYEF